MKAESDLWLSSRKTWLLFTCLLLFLIFCFINSPSTDNQQSSYSLFLGGKKKYASQPYLLLTLLDSTNVLKYSLDGYLLDDSVLLGESDSADFSLGADFRTMILGDYLNRSNVLYIAYGWENDSQINIYDSCDAYGKRSFVRTAISTSTNPGAMHAYGLTFDQDANLFASFLDTDVVLHFQRDTFEPFPLPPALIHTDRSLEYYPGTFYQFGKPATHNVDEEGLRGVVRVKDSLWIANQDIGGVALVTLATGVITDIVIVPGDPIALIYDKGHHLVFVSSRAKHWQGAVYAISPETLRIVGTYSTFRMDHPTGIATHGDNLYVAEQNLAKVYAFNIHSQKLLGSIIDHIPGLVEGLMLSPC